MLTCHISFSDIPFSLFPLLGSLWLHWTHMDNLTAYLKTIHIITSGKPFWHVGWHIYLFHELRFKCLWEVIYLYTTINHVYRFMPSLKFLEQGPGMVVHIYVLNYSGGRNQEVCSLKLAWISPPPLLKS
jgi:hypothetical protein